MAGLGLLQSVIRVLAAAFDETGGGSSTVGAVVFGLHAVNALVMMGVAAP